MRSKDQRPGDRHTGPPQRSVRGIDDALWQAAKEKAQQRGTTVSTVVREILKDWTERT